MRKVRRPDVYNKLQNGERGRQGVYFGVVPKTLLSPSASQAKFLGPAEFAMADQTRLGPARPVMVPHNLTSRPEIPYIVTTGEMTYFDTGLEVHEAGKLDTDPRVTYLRGQPTVLHIVDGAKHLVHVFDIYAEDVDATKYLLDVRPRARRDDKFKRKAAASREACALIGFQYRVCGRFDPIVDANLIILRAACLPAADVTAEAYAVGELAPAEGTHLTIRQIVDLAEQAGIDRSLALGLVRRLLFLHHLEFDARQPVDITTPVWRGRCHGAPFPPHLIARP